MGIKYTFEDWLNGNLKEWYKTVYPNKNFDDDLIPHALISSQHEINLGEFQMINNKQAEIFHRLAEVKANLELELFESRTKHSTDLKKSIKNEIIILEKRINELGEDVKNRVYRGEHNIGGITSKMVKFVDGLESNISDLSEDEIRSILLNWPNNNNELEGAVYLNIITKLEDELSPEKPANNKKYDTADEWLIALLKDIKSIEIPTTSQFLKVIESHCNEFDVSKYDPNFNVMHGDSFNASKIFNVIAYLFELNNPGSDPDGSSIKRRAIRKGWW